MGVVLFTIGLHCFSFLTGYIAMRWVSLIWAIVTGMVSLIVLLLHPPDVAYVLAGPLLPEWWGNVWLGWQVIHSAWLISFVPRELRAMFI